MLCTDSLSPDSLSSVEEPSKMSDLTDLYQLMEQEIPEGRQHLHDSHNNLEKVAAYCEGNYLQALDKRHALEETKNYTTQSLASVAYQINTLGTNFLHLLDLLTHQLATMESSVNHLSQTVMIHKEKVARREIGVLTTNKTTSRPAGVKNPGIIFPDQPERAIKYVRKPIDYTLLDTVGHGVTVQAQNPRNITRRPSSTSTKSSTSAGSAPTTKPPTPPSGPIQRQQSSPYRTPAPPVAPPQVPSNYAPSPYQMHQKERRTPGGYAALPIQKPTTQPPPPPTGKVQPMTHAPPSPGGPIHMGRIASPGIHRGHDHMEREAEPPPPLPGMLYRDRMGPGNVSPPLPPPPEMPGGDHVEMPPPPTYVATNYPGGRDQYEIDHYAVHRAPISRSAADWIPKVYIEKVVAIYDYHKDKDDELSFREGAVIYVVKKNDDGWYEGVMDGCTGLFPGNYVESCI